MAAKKPTSKTLKTTVVKKKSKAAPKKKAAAAGATKKKGFVRRTITQADAEGKHLVIVESPTKAKTINKYLGPDYLVMASVGHIRDLPSRNPKGVKNPVPGVDLENNFEPTYEVMPDSTKTVNELKKAAKYASDVWFATDLDREGEAIAWHVAHALKYPIKDAKRVVFNAITKTEIQHAFDNPRPLEINRIDAQQARRILDRIVGYQVSPLLWKKVAGGLSAGRVQSVATRLVVEREREIDAFIPDEYWKITGLFTPDLANAGDLGDRWRAYLNVDEDTNERTVKDQNAWLTDAGALRAELADFNGKKFNPTDRKAAREAAEALGFKVENEKTWEPDKAKGPAKHRIHYEGVVANAPQYTITDIETRRTKSRPSPPFITSTLQQQASTRMGFNLRRTMRVAQQLYEGIDLKGARGQTGLITYMRTDSTHLSAEAVGAVRDYVGGSSKLGNKYLPDKPIFYKSSNKDAQEAHEAIRPTDVTLTPQELQGKLSEEQYKLYDLIWRRFVSCQMVPAEYDATAVSIKPAGVNATFRATGSILVFDGYQKIMGIPKKDAALLPRVEKDQELAPLDLTPTQHFTSPPARFTEASLQKKLEEEGIGRPSTYAAIISTIQDRKYVEPLTPRDKRLRATDMGQVVTDKLIEAFPQIMDVGYTRGMEAKLDEIESENKDWRETLQEFYDPFKDQLDNAHETMTHAKAASEPSDHVCPTCGSACEFRFGRNGRFLSCTAFNVPPVKVKPEGHGQPESGGDWLLHKAKGKARPKIQTEDASEKVGWSKLTKDDKAKFQALSDSMPEPCRFAAPIDSDGNPLQPELTDILCPEDSEPMIRRTGRFGPFLASSNYPEVKYIVKLDPKKGHVVLPKAPPMTTEIVCPTCGEQNDNATLYLRDSKRGLWLSCSRFPKCRGRVGFGKLDEDVQASLEKAWKVHLEGNPIPEIRTASGHVIQEGEEYLPVIEGAEVEAGAGSA